MPRTLHAVSVGHGPRVVLVHGSAADHTTWTIQLAAPALRARFELVAYDRRGTGASVEPGGEAEAPRSAGEHADDLAALIEGRARTTAPLPPAGPVLAVGSSFGAVCVLECARRRPDLLRGMVLCEPPLPPSDDAPPVPAGFLEELDAAAAAGGPAAGAEHFLRTVLGDAAYERMPRAYRVRAAAPWPAIRADCAGLAAYRVRYPELAGVAVPALLLGGDRSAPYFGPTLEALAAALPRARRATLAGAGHMMHAEAHRAFAEELLAFAGALADGGG
jgi:pimeloyl-ACP methyl ester carboxylesterase